MDDIRSYIARSSNRAKDQIEKADTALGAVAATLLESGDARYVCVVTTDTDAGKALSPHLQPTASKVESSLETDSS
ncbi:hypothetical protein C436_21225 [Haloarcula marismortui ATCC 33800]|uniref:Uncharacterized protein n=1 Tax=Haloarcula marismortui ATCC 33800 TaxID=662476 RepID=M0JHZ7_9EURY|nr:hypothetical protein C436_21225 [Haloarcula sinaiiensis ATCC 33800]